MKIKQIIFRLSIALLTFVVGVCANLIFLNNVFPAIQDSTQPVRISTVEAVDEEDFIDLVHSAELNEDYAVYSAVLNKEIYRGEAVVIGSSTSNEATNDSIYSLHSLKFYFSNSDKDTFNDLVAKNKAEQRLGNFFNFGGSVFFLTRKEEKEMFVNPDGWNKFSDKYPGANKLIKFSAVGFNRTRTQALVHVTVNCVVSCIYREFIFLKKKDGKWILYNRGNPPFS